MRYSTENLEIIDIGTICEVLNVSRNTAYSLLSETPDKDKITAWKVGNRWKCSRAALDEYICKHAHLVLQ